MDVDLFFVIFFIVSYATYHDTHSLHIGDIDEKFS